MQNVCHSTAEHRGLVTLAPALDVAIANRSHPAGANMLSVRILLANSPSIGQRFALLWCAGGGRAPI